MINELINIFGKSIQNEDVKSFIEKYGYKYPKKDTISGRASNRDYWVTGKETGIDLFFSIETNNSKYSPEKTERKGIFYPILTNISIYSKSKLVLDNGISFNTTLEEGTKILGKPKKGSEYWSWRVQDDGTEKIYIWDIIIDKERDIRLFIEYDVEDEEISGITLMLNQIYPIITLYDQLLGQDVSVVEKSRNSFYTKNGLFFLYWLLTNDCIPLKEEAKAHIDELKSNKITIWEYVRDYYHPPYIGKENLKEEYQDFFWKYEKNMNGYDIVYQSDFALAFLKDEKLRSNYLGEAAFIEMSKIEYTAENHAVINDIITRRYNEFRKHGFAKSSKIY